MPTSTKHSAPILLVDDDKLILTALEETLKREGYNLLSARTGNDAVDILKKHTIALIVCDQRMPGMNGIEVLQHAQAMQPDAIRIVLTGNSDLDTVLKAINIGQISQFLVKPWDDALLKQTIAASLEKYRLLKEIKDLHQLTVIQHDALTKNHEKLKNDLQLGARIHETLLEGKIPANIPGFSIKATTIPSQEIDGDFFEFYRPAAQILDVVIGDVMGKGIPAALVGTAVKTQLMRFTLPFSRSHTIDNKGFWEEDLLQPHEILSRVHEELVKPLIHLDFFTSLFYGRFNSQKHTLTFVDCGSTKPIHYQASTKKSKTLIGGNLPLGALEENSYNSLEIHYAKDDVFIFYSDGVTETKSPTNELYGYDRLIKIAEKHADKDPDFLIDTIKSSVKAFAQKDFFDDDLTLIIIKILNQDESALSSRHTAKFFADPSQLKAVREFVDRLTSQVPGDRKQLSSQLQLAINEAFCNIVFHGYGSKADKIVQIQSELTESGILIELSDQGKVFNPDGIQEPSLAGDKTNGFGWYIIRGIADNMTYVSKESETGWNHLRIFKKYIL